MGQTEAEFTLYNELKIYTDSIVLLVSFSST